MAPRFGARVDVGQVNLNDGFFDGGDGIAQSIRVVRERARIEQNDTAVSSVKRVNKRAFMVRLEGLHFDGEVVAYDLQAFVDGVERGRAINRRLARAEQIQIGAV